MKGAPGAILKKRSDMIGAASCAKGVETRLEKLGAAAAECREARASAEAGGAACTPEEGRKVLLEARDRVAAQFGNQRAFEEEAGGDAALQNAYRKMGGYSD
eukprot:3057403-Pyramimonas_sp.AAC.1